MGDSGVLRVGILFVVNRRCKWPRASVPARGANDDSSRGDLRPARSPMPAEKAIFATNTLRRRRSALRVLAGRMRGGLGGEGTKRSCRADVETARERRATAGEHAHRR